MHSRWAISQEHLDDFFQILVQFIEGCALGMRARKAGHVANHQSASMSRSMMAAKAAFIIKVHRLAARMSSAGTAIRGFLDDNQPL